STGSARSLRHVPGDGVLVDVAAELGEFVRERATAPARVLASHLPDERNVLRRERRSSDAPRLPGPEASEAPDVEAARRRLRHPDVRRRRVAPTHRLLPGTWRRPAQESRRRAHEAARRTLEDRYRRARHSPTRPRPERPMDRGHGHYPAPAARSYPGGGVISRCLG